MSPIDPEKLSAFYDAFLRLELTDRQFDLMYPDPIRFFSAVHWTPVSAARRASELLVTDKNSRILDIGSGVGKFCIIGAMHTGAHFTGIEQRAWLNDIAKGTARRLGLDQVTFNNGDMQSIDWDEFDGFYLYNPFEESREPEIAIDDRIEFGFEAALQNVYYCQGKFREAPVGTRVVLFNGFGGTMPPEYVLKVEESMFCSSLELWIKESS